MGRNIDITMNKKKARGRPKFEGGTRIVIHLTQDLVLALKKRQAENPGVKKAVLLREAIKLGLIRRSRTTDGR